jgi:MSHA pilin protein MshC
MTNKGSRLDDIRMAGVGLRAACRLHSGPQQGFTLVELVMAIVLIGVLSVVALPRLASRSDVSARGFHDSTLAYLRFAQKSAVAQRRTVCVAFTANGLTLTMAAAEATFSCGASPSLVGPNGESSAALTSDSASYSAQPGTLRFDGLGQPVNATGATIASQTVQVANAGKTITVEAVTGFVHD